MGQEFLQSLFVGTPSITSEASHWYRYQWPNLASILCGTISAVADPHPRTACRIKSLDSDANPTARRYLSSTPDPISCRWSQLRPNRKGAADYPTDNLSLETALRTTRPRGIGAAAPGEQAAHRHACRAGPGMPQVAAEAPATEARIGRCADWPLKWVLASRACNVSSLQARLRPHQLQRYMVSNDAQFEKKAADIIGLYMDPPQHAAFFCVDEKTAIQALDRLVRSCHCHRLGPSVTASYTTATARYRFTSSTIGLRTRPRP